MSLSKQNHLPEHLKSKSLHRNLLNSKNINSLPEKIQKLRQEVSIGMKRFDKGIDTKHEMINKGGNIMSAYNYLNKVEFNKLGLEKKQKQKDNQFDYRVEKNKLKLNLTTLNKSE
jgi:hypothetical protein